MAKRTETETETARASTLETGEETLGELETETGAQDGESEGQLGTERRYTAVRGSHLTDRDAAIIGPELERLAAAYGAESAEGLTPDDIIAAARPESSPLHRYFEWDASKAHAEYLRERARYLARSWRVVIVYRDDTSHPTRFTVPGLVSVKLEPASGQEEPQRAYVPIARALETPAYRAQLLADAEARLTYWYERFQMYRNLPEFSALASVFAAIEELGIATAPTSAS